MKKPLIFIIIVLSLSLLFSLSSVLADGCFLYPDSTAYCTEISSAEAQEECSFQDRCETKKVFQDNVLCSSLTDCQKFICKASCREDFSGRCPQGPASETDCKTGCCQFQYSLGQQLPGTFCNYTLSKQGCEIEARNKASSGYFFNTQLNAKSCTLWCNEGKNISNRLEPVLFLSQPTKDKPFQFGKIILYLLAIIVVIVGIYFLLQKLVNKYLPDLDWNRIQEKPKALWNRFNPFHSNPETKENIQSIQKIHQDKVRRHLREELLGSPTLSTTHFHRLKKIAHPGRKEFEALNLDAFQSFPQSSSSTLKTTLQKKEESELKKEDLFKKLKDLSNK